MYTELSFIDVSLLGVPDDARIQLESSSMGASRNALQSPVVLDSVREEEALMRDEVIPTVDIQDVHKQSPELDDTVDNHSPELDDTVDKQSPKLVDTVHNQSPGMDDTDSAAVVSQIPANDDSVTTELTVPVVIDILPGRIEASETGTVKEVALPTALSVDQISNRNVQPLRCNPDPQTEETLHSTPHVDISPGLESDDDALEDNLSLQQEREVDQDHVPLEVVIELAASASAETSTFSLQENQTPIQESRDIDAVTSDVEEQVPEVEEGVVAIDHPASDVEEQDSEVDEGLVEIEHAAKPLPGTVFSSYLILTNCLIGLQVSGSRKRSANPVIRYRTEITKKPRISKDVVGTLTDCPSFYLHLYKGTYVLR
jgi:hypothetical protein